MRKSITPRTAGPLSARSRGNPSRLLAGRLIVEASATKAPASVPAGFEEPDEVDEDEEFRDLRKQVKQHLLERRNSRSTPRDVEPLSARSRTSRPNITAAAVLGPSGGVGVDPIYFDYGAATRALRAKVQEEKAAVAGEDASTKEMVTFLSAQGLSGPLRAYAKALALQGVTQPSEQIKTENSRLSRLLTLSEFDSTDELLLLDGLRQLR
ncbi:unnamed protein product [Durusdinium trenchii]|uniref:Uncharacterized protein n=1 Tax=Durusdinium trenchii TaxID=1381693 RepID=A0ABP0N979_9DINO